VIGLPPVESVTGIADYINNNVRSYVETWKVPTATVYGPK